MLRKTSSLNLRLNFQRIVIRYIGASYTFTKFLWQINFFNYCMSTLLSITTKYFNACICFFFFLNTKTNICIVCDQLIKKVWQATEPGRRSFGGRIRVAPHDIFKYECFICLSTPVSKPFNVIHTKKSMGRLHLYFIFYLSIKTDLTKIC